MSCACDAVGLLPAGDPPCDGRRAADRCLQARGELRHQGRALGGTDPCTTIQGSPWRGQEGGSPRPLCGRAAPARSGPASRGPFTWRRLAVVLLACAVLWALAAYGVYLLL